MFKNCKKWFLQTMLNYAMFILVNFQLFCQQNDVEVPIPKYFLHERQKVLKDREQLLGKILSKMEPSSKDQVGVSCSSRPVYP